MLTRLSVGILSTLAIVSAVAAQDLAAKHYPTRPVTIVVPFAAGGPNDVLARIVADHMARTLAQPVLIENVAGAGGTMGSARAAKAEPDGHTLLSGNLGSLAAGFALYKNVKYDPRDFASVGMLAGTPNFLVVRKDFPATTLTEFIAYAKAHPEKVTVGNAGLGSNAHLVCLYLEHLAGLKLSHVPYRGTGPAMKDLLGGQIDAMCDSAPNVVPQVVAGMVRALVVAQPARVAATPDVPTAREAGLPDFNVVGWNAIVAPPATPKEIVAKANAALSAALNDPAVRKKIEDIGAIPPPAEEASPAWMDKFLRSEVDQWGKVVRAAGVSVE
jgi:tripartite-type tricarboxylate transporter receptor subunit TctC